MVASSILMIALAVTGQKTVDPAMLVGIWEVVKSDETPVGSTVEFTRDGKLQSIPKGNGSSFAGTYRVKGDRVMVEPNSNSLTITELTSTKLVLDGNVEYRRRGASAAAPKAVRKSGGSPVGAQPKGSAGWKVVALLEGRATVELPREPSQKLGGGNLDDPIHRFFCFSTLAETPGLDYAILVFRGEGDVAPADEAKALEVARERAVTHFGSNGKVVSDKAIRSRAGAGREFEMTIERRPAGTVKARGRAFFHENTIYLLMSVSKARGRDLPPEAGRFLDSLEVSGRIGDAVAEAIPEGGPPGRPMPPGRSAATATLVLSALKVITAPNQISSFLRVGQLLASLSPGPRPGGAMSRVNPAEAVPAPIEIGATPVALKPNAPEPRTNRSRVKANALDAWGTEVDPDGDVAIEASGMSLAMKIPGTPHVLAPERDKMNAPRVVAPVRGDFVVSVRVDGTFQPSDKSTVKGLSSRQAGGLILWKDSRNYLVFQRRASAGDEGNDTNQAVLEELVSGSKGATHRQAAQDGPVFLRLERKRGRISAAFSADGNRWKELKPVDTTWAEGEVQVGVVAVSTSTGPHPVKFDDYSLRAR